MQDNIDVAPKKRLPNWLYWGAASYAGALLLVVSVQALCLFFLWRPPADWVSFLSRFATSPAIAGFAAVGAAIIGAQALARQLAYAKEKAADEAWWEQFEWVTDRVMPQDGSDSKLARPLAVDLLTSLVNSARASFQKDAVGGIMEHHLSPSGLAEEDSSQQPAIDEKEASSLRNFVKASKNAPRAATPALRALAAFDYEARGLEGLIGLGLDVVARSKGFPDAILTSGKKKIGLEFRLSGASAGAWGKLARAMADLSVRAGAEKCLFITDAELSPSSLEAIAAEGVSIVVWDQDTGAEELKRLIQKVVDE